MPGGTGGSPSGEASWLLAELRRRWWLIVAIVAVAVASAVAVSQSRRASYQATAIMLFGQGALANSPGGAGTGSGTTTPQDQATDLALASLDTVAARVKEQVAGKMTIGQVKRAVTVQLNGNTNLVSVTATADTPARAALIANTFANQIVAFRRQIGQAQIQQSIDAINKAITTRQADRNPGTAQSSAASPAAIQSLKSRLAGLETLKALQTGDVQVVQRATPPPTASARHVARDAVIAVLVGLAIAIVVVLLVAKLDDRIRDEPQLSIVMSAPVLARIPKLSRLKRSGHAASAQQDRAFVDAFELLRLNLQLTRPTICSSTASWLQHEHLIVGVTSLAAGDGKTTVVASLARTFALSGVDVVAVDFDLDDPGLHACFDVDHQPTGGVLGALRDGDSQGHLQATEYSHLRLLPSAQLPSRLGAVVHEQVALMLARLAESADYVLVDTGPIVVGPEASAVVAAADGVILVVDLERARRSDLLAAKRQLEMTRTTLLGIVVNRTGAAIPAHRPHDRALAIASGNGPPTFAG